MNGRQEGEKKVKRGRREGRTEVKDICKDERKEARNNGWRTGKINKVKGREVQMEGLKERRKAGRSERK